MSHQLICGLMFCLGVGLACTASKLIQADQTEVLIYYANETAPDDEELENFLQFEKWLTEIGSEKSLRIAEGLKRDRTLFASAVDEEISEIQTASKQADVKILIATNRLARENAILYFEPSHGWQQHSLKYEESENYVVSSNRLAIEVNLRGTLEYAAELCDPAAHRFLLVTKSHGSNERMLQVTLSRRKEEFTRKKLEQSLLNSDSEELPLHEQFGVTRKEFLELLSNLGRDRKMRFALVFMESCQGRIDSDLAEELPNNVSLLASSGNRDLGYRTLDYQQLFGQLNGKQSLALIMEAQLTENYQTARHKSSPLVAWITFGLAALLGSYLFYRVFTSFRSTT